MPPFRVILEALLAGTNPVAGATFELPCGRACVVLFLMLLKLRLGIESLLTGLATERLGSEHVASDSDL